MRINLITVTGHPGSGKTEVLGQIKTDFGKNGISFAEIDEYRGHIRPWAEENRQSDLINNWWKDEGRENFVLNLAAYEVMCPVVAMSIADEIVGIYRESEPMVFLLEAARNVGIPKVGYVDGLWLPLREGLRKEKASQINIVNVEVVGGRREVLWRRLEERLKEKPKTAPPECLNNYHFDKESGMPILASNELRGNQELVELSLTIENGSGWKDLEKEIEIVTREIRQEAWWPREGVLRTNSRRKEY